MDQLSWILEGQVSLQSIEEVTNLSRISFKEYNTTVNWITSCEKSTIYYHCAQNVGFFYPFPQYCNGLIANLLIYHTTDAVLEELHEPQRIASIFKALTLYL